jgi:hypothetical protein
MNQEDKQESISQQSEVVRSYNPSTHEAEAGGSQIQYQPELYNETLSQKSKG